MAGAPADVHVTLKLASERPAPVRPVTVTLGVTGGEMIKEQGLISSNLNITLFYVD